MYTKLIVFLLPNVQFKEKLGSFSFISKSGNGHQGILYWSDY